MYTMGLMRQRTTPGKNPRQQPQGGQRSMQTRGLIWMRQRTSTWRSTEAMEVKGAGELMKIQRRMEVITKVRQCRRIKSEELRTRQVRIPHRIGPQGGVPRQREEERRLPGEIKRQEHTLFDSRSLQHQW